MRLEAAACRGTPSEWPLEFLQKGGRETEVLSTRSLVERALGEYLALKGAGGVREATGIADIAASVQENLARGIAHIAIHAARDRGIRLVALSGGVAYNAAIRETIRREVTREGLTLFMNREYPLGDGCISYGQCVWAGVLRKEG
jgi:hydrogenase maturation protein HypF